MPKISSFPSLMIIFKISWKLFPPIFVNTLSHASKNFNNWGEKDHYEVFLSILAGKLWKIARFCFCVSVQIIPKFRCFCFGIKSCFGRTLVGSNFSQRPRFHCLRQKYYLGKRFITEAILMLNNKSENHFKPWPQEIKTFKSYSFYQIHSNWSPIEIRLQSNTYL